jgi:hypothetical protein
MWSPVIYCQHADETTARAAATALGVIFPSSEHIPTGNENYALYAPMPAPWITSPVIDDNGIEITPGVQEQGYWSMLRFNTNWIGYEATLTAIEASGVRRHIDNPSVVWA